MWTTDSAGLPAASDRGRTGARWMIGVVLLFAGGCAARQSPTDGTGCGSDRDCKLDRICENRHCVWPQDRSSGKADGGSASAAAHADLAAGTAMLDPPPTSPTPGAMFRFDAQHRGRSPYVLPGSVPTVLWKFDTGGPVTSSPTVLPDGAVAFGSHDGLVYVVDPLGQKRFAFPTGDLVFASPAVDPAGTIYVGSGDDHLYAFDSGTLRLAWRVRLGACAATRGVGPEESRCDVDGGPTLGPDGTLYVGGHGVFAIAPDGKIKWHFATPGRIPTAPALLPNGTIVAGGHDKTLFALGADGQKRWDFHAAGDIESTPAVAEDGSLYFGADDRKVYALNASGELLWAFNTGGEVRASPALGRDGNVLVGSFDGQFYAIARSGTLAWTFRTGDRIASSALVDAQGAIAFGSEDDRIYALESSGQPRWSVELGADVDSSPTLGPDGTLFVGCDDRSLYALRAPSP